MSKTTPPQSVVIIGNGISGITLARNLRKKSAIPIRIISEETPYFFSRTALMYVFMGHMRFEDTQPYENDFWEKIVSSPILYVYDHVTCKKLVNKALELMIIQLDKHL